MRGSIEWNRPEAVRGASAGDNDSVVLEDFVIVFRKNGNAVIIAALIERHERPCLEIVEDKSRPRLGAQRMKRGRIPLSVEGMTVPLAE
jgi:hypothetical protein